MKAIFEKNNWGNASIVEVSDACCSDMDESLNLYILIDARRFSFVIRWAGEEGWKRGETPIDDEVFSHEVVIMGEKPINVCPWCGEPLVVEVIDVGNNRVGIITYSA